MDTPKVMTSDIAKLPAMMLRYMTEDKIDAVPHTPIPTQPINFAEVLNLSDRLPTIYGLGHSS